MPTVCMSASCLPPTQVNALLCVAMFGRPCFAARAEDAKAADVMSLIPWKAAAVLTLTPTLTLTLTLTLILTLTLTLTLTL